MRLNVIRSLSVVPIAILFFPPSAVAQKSNDSPTTNPSPTTATATGPLSDYVPCIFPADDQLSMRALPPAQKPEKPLDTAKAEILFNKAAISIQDVLDSHKATREFVNAFQAYYFAHLSPDSLVGLTQEQAVSKIQFVVSQATREAKAVAPRAVRVLTDEEIGNLKNKAANALVDKLGNAISTLQAEKGKNQAPSNAELIRAGHDAIANDSDLPESYRTNVLHLYQDLTTGMQNRPNLLSQQELEHTVSEAAEKAFFDPYTGSEDQIDLAFAELNANLSTGTAKAATTAPAKQFQPPNDVSCSMAVLSWKETSDVFGRRVANTFVAIQVTLRNLNTKNEFLIHDMQVAVDTGVSPEYFGRFQAGRDKLLVRAVAQRGQSSDRRNVILNVLLAAGSIAAATSLTAGTVELKDAVAVFQGAFIPGFANIFPDHTVEQLNHINDLVFSASSTSKVVVPVQGSVPLVTFISERPIEQLPFAWCGHPPSGKLKRWFGDGTEQNCNFNGGSHQPGYVTPYRYTKGGKLLSEGRGDDSPPQGPVVDRLPPWNNLKYGDWSAAAVRMLQEHTFVVVGGIHIQEVVTQPKVTNLDCPALSSGQMDISQTKDGMVTCSVTGSGLNLVSAVTLQKGDSKIAGKIKPATDGNSATLTFKPEDMCGSEGTYSLFLTYKSDVQNPTDLDSGESALLAKQPTVSSISFSNDTLTLNGACLDQVDTVSLAPAVTSDATVKGGALTLGTDGKNTTATSIFALQTESNKTGLKPGANYYLTYTAKVQPNVGVKNETLTVKVQQSSNSAQTQPGASAQPQKPTTATKTPGTNHAKPANPGPATKPGGSKDKPQPQKPTTATKTNDAKPDNPSSPTTH